VPADEFVEVGRRRWRKFPKLSNGLWPSVGISKAVTSSRGTSSRVKILVVIDTYD
jgi:hypothetical protein